VWGKDCADDGVTLCIPFGLAGLHDGFFVGCVNCRVVVVAWGVDSRRGCGLLLPACSFPSPRGWFRASQALHSCGTRPIFVASSICCSVGVVS